MSLGVCDPEPHGLPCSQAPGFCNGLGAGMRALAREGVRVCPLSPPSLHEAKIGTLSPSSSKFKLGHSETEQREASRLQCRCMGVHIGMKMPETVRQHRAHRTFLDKGERGGGMGS